MTEIFTPNTCNAYGSFRIGGEEWPIRIGLIRKIRLNENGSGTLIFRFGELATDEGFEKLRDTVNAAILEHGGKYE